MKGNISGRGSSALITVQASDKVRIAAETIIGTLLLLLLSGEGEGEGEGVLEASMDESIDAFSEEDVRQENTCEDR